MWILHFTEESSSHWSYAKRKKRQFSFFQTQGTSGVIIQNNKFSFIILSPLPIRITSSYQTFLYLIMLWHRSLLFSDCSIAGKEESCRPKSFFRKVLQDSYWMLMLLDKLCLKDLSSVLSDNLCDPSNKRFNVVQFCLLNVKHLCVNECPQVVIQELGIFCKVNADNIVKT